MKKIILFIAILVGFGLMANAQSAATDTFNDGNGNMPVVGTNFDVPIDVTGFDATAMPNGITAITIYFEFDDMALDYTGYTNDIGAPLTTDVVLLNDTTLKIEVYDWTNVFFNVDDGKLLDLQFDYLGGYSILEFRDATPFLTIYADENFNEIAITNLTNGAVEGFFDNTIDGGDWNTASDWTLNAVPTVWHNVTVAAGTEATAAAAAMCNDLTVEQGGQLTLSSTLDVDGDFMIESDATGSGSFINNGTLTVTGTSSAQCYVTNGQWHGIASPVSGETFAALYLGGSPEVWIKEYDETANDYSDVSDIATPIGDMQGWFTFIQTSGSPQTFNFEGPYRTGTVGTANNMVHANTGHNYVGNPFTSAIDWDAVSGWTKTNMYDAIYVYNNGNWASYVGGTGVSGGSRYVAMSQGFFVQVGAAGTGTLSMDEDVCVHNTVGYLKSQNTEQEIVRLEIEDAGMVDEAVIVFKDGATEDYDGDYDAHKFFSFNADYPQIYSTANDFMSINALPFTAQESVALDVRGKDGNSLTITATEGDDFEYLILKDAVTGESVNLKEKSYTFIYDAEIVDRFSLHFSPLGVIDNPLSGDAVKIFAYDNNIQVVLDGTDHANISVYNLLGQEVTTRSANTSITSIPMNKPGYYLVKVSDGKNYSTQKVFIK